MKTARKARIGRNKFKPQYRRLLHIDEQIRKGGYPNCTTLGRAEEVSYKTIMRDIDYLRDELQAPIEFDKTRRGFHYTDQTWFLPSLLLTEGELMALLIGTQAMTMYKGTPVAGTLQAIYGKLAAMLPDKITLAPELVFTHMSFINSPARPISAEIWKAVIRGLMHQRVMEIDYQAPRSMEPKHHQIHPLHLANIEGDWYLLARDPRWEDVTQFAVSRIKHAELSEQAFQPPPDFNAGETLSRRSGKYIHQGGKKSMVQLLFSAPLAPFVSEKVWHPDQKLRLRKDGRLELAVPTYAPETLLPWIMSFGSNATVLTPRALRVSLGQEARKMAAIYKR